MEFKRVFLQILLRRHSISYWAISSNSSDANNLLKNIIFTKKIQPHEVLTIKPFPPFRPWTRISSRRNVQRLTLSFLVGVLSLQHISVKSYTSAMEHRSKASQVPLPHRQKCPPLSSQWIHHMHAPLDGASYCFLDEQGFEPRTSRCLRIATATLQTNRPHIHITHGNKLS